MNKFNLQNKEIIIKITSNKFQENNVKHYFANVKHG